MRHRRVSIRLIGPFAIVSGLMVVALGLSLFAAASEIDQVRKAREQVLVESGFQQSVKDLEAAVTPQVIWDEAVAKLDLQFDRAWAEANIGQFLNRAGFELVYILDGAGKPLQAMEGGRRVANARFGDHAAAVAPLIAKVRQSEAARGAPSQRPRSRALISSPIHASAVKATPRGLYVLTASLVQPDFGAAMPSERAPVIITGEALDTAFFKAFGTRFLLRAPLSLVPATDEAGLAHAVLNDERGRPVGAIAWKPEKPGTKLLLNLLGPIGLVIFAFGAVSLFLLLKAGKATKALADSESRLGMALGAANAGAFEIDFVAKTFWCSPELIALFGRELTFADVGSWPWPMVHPEDHDVFTPRKADAARLPPGPRPPFEVRILTPDGETRWLRFYVEANREPGAPAAQVSGLVLDIDERKRQELALIEAQRAAQAGAEAKSQFLASVSHEIRTPMNGVVGVLHLLKSEKLTRLGRQLLGEALACSQMLASLVDDVLDFSRIEADRMELNPAPTDPAEVLEGVASLLRGQAEAKGVTLTTEIDPGVGPVLTDPIRLRQCLFNLVGNAVKFTTEGAVAVGVRRIVGEDGPRLRFEVADTGIGISEDVQARLFQRFQQADSSTTRRYGGTGLGLAITKRLAEMMGGSVGVTSREGEGSLFWLEIAAPDASIQAPAPEGELAGLEGVRILVVEDNATNRLIVTKILERLGAAVEVATDGEAGVAAARHARFDLILMDIQMPGIDGMEASRQIRASGGPAAEVPIIALTANVIDDQRGVYLAAGMNGMVAKPITPSALLAEIVRCCAGEDEEETLEALAG